MHLRYGVAVLVTSSLLLSACIGTATRNDSAMPSPTPVPRPLSADAATVAYWHTEVEITAEHARYAIAKREEFDWVRRYLRHVRHALDPASEPDGPGLNYGVIATSRQLETSMATRGSDSALAADTRANIVTVRTSAANVAAWANDIMVHSDNILAESSTNALVDMWLETVSRLARAMVSGTEDAPGMQQGKAAFARLQQ